MSFPNVFESTQPFSKQPPGIIGGHECWDSLPWPLVHSVQGGHRHRWEIRHGSKVRQWGKVGLTWSGILKLPQFFWGGICSETLKFSGSYKESSKPFAGFPSVVSRIWCSDTLEMTRGMFLMGILNPNKPCADATWRGLAWFRVSSMHKVQFVWDWVTCGLTKNRFQTPFQDPIHEQIYLLSVYMHIYIYIQKLHTHGAWSHMLLCKFQMTSWIGCQLVWGPDPEPPDHALLWYERAVGLWIIDPGDPGWVDGFA